LLFEAVLSHCTLWDIVKSEVFFYLFIYLFFNIVALCLTLWRKVTDTKTSDLKQDLFVTKFTEMSL